MKKRILILNTGGTISAVKTKNGYEPVAGYVETSLKSIEALKQPSMPDYVIREYEPLLDSSNFRIDDWNQIASIIRNEYDNYDGFVIFHGTDTMAYTASALSFMLENLGKPVILTGSQLPLSEVRNDAYDHIVMSLWLAAHQPLYEVCIYFNYRLLRGNRSRKLSVDKFHAFDTPNFPDLATIGTAIILEETRLIPKPQSPFQIQTLQLQQIATFRLYPGFSMDVLKHLVEQPLQALILETFGAGNAPNTDPYFLSLLKNALNREILVINCTQCLQGAVEMKHYATGHSLYRTGLISGKDMTPETVHAKLLYLFSKNLLLPEIKNLMQTNLRGEIT